MALLAVTLPSVTICVDEWVGSAIQESPFKPLSPPDRVPSSHAQLSNLPTDVGLLWAVSECRVFQIRKTR